MTIKVKAFTAAMKKKIAKAATDLAIAAPDISEGGGKTYEAWVLMELALRLKAYVAVTPCDHAGHPTTAFRVRGGPGFIPQVHATGSQPSHFLLAGTRTRAELHSSVRHQGSSGDTHELDLSIVDHAKAVQIRNGQGGPFNGGLFGEHVLLGIELKEYDAEHSLPKLYARALLGLTLDLEPFGYLILGRRRGLQIATPSRTDYWLLTTTSLGTSVQLLRHHQIQARTNVEPGANDGAVQEVADQLRRRLL